jgi:hypothetical protein
MISALVGSVVPSLYSITVESETEERMTLSCGMATFTPWVCPVSSQTFSGLSTSSHLPSPEQCLADSIRITGAVTGGVGPPPAAGYESQAVFSTRNPTASAASRRRLLIIASPYFGKRE